MAVDWWAVRQIIRCTINKMYFVSKQYLFMYKLIEVRERTNTQMPQRRHTGVKIEKHCNVSIHHYSWYICSTVMKFLNKKEIKSSNL